MKAVLKLNALLEEIFMHINARSTATLMLAVLLTSQFLRAGSVTATKPAQPPAAKPDATLSVGERLGDRKLTEFSLEGGRLSEAIDFIQDIIRVNMFIDWASLEKAGIGRHTPVTVQITKQGAVDGVRKFFAAVTARDGTRPVQVSFEGRYVYVGTQESIRSWQRQNAQIAKLITEQPAAVKVLTKTLPEVKFERMPMEDAVAFLQDVTGTPIKPDWKSLGKLQLSRGMPISMRMEEFTVGDALVTMFTRSAAGGPTLTFSWDGNALGISAAK